MPAEPRYKLEVVVAVLDAWPGCSRCVVPTDPGAYAWVRTDAAGHVHVGSYAPEGRLLTIRQDHLVAIAVQLGIEPDDLVQTVKGRGGEHLGP